MYDVQALCGLLHPLSLNLTIIWVQCRARNHNPTTVAAIRSKIWRIAATIVGLGFLDTALYINQYCQNREPRRGSKAANHDIEPRRGTKTRNKNGESRLRTKTENGERRISREKDGEKEREKKVYPVSVF